MCIELLIEIKLELREYLGKCETLEEMLDVSLHGMFLIDGLCAGLRGEELPLMSLDAMRRYYQVEQPTDPAIHHVCLAMRGNAKGKTTEEY
jgi:hypothetical protein